MVRSSIFALAVLFAVNLLNFLDRQIPGAVAEPIRKEMGLSDTALGVIATAFTLIYAAVGLPFGRLADRGPRKWLLAGGVFFWSLLTAAGGLARNFFELVVFRLGVGVGEAVCAPIAVSLLGDLFPSGKRARAMSIFMLGLPIGLAMAYLVGGWVAKEWGWRAAFFVAAAPGLLCAFAILFLPDPPRGAAEAHAIGSARRPGSPFLLVLSIPTMWWIIASGALHNFNMYAMGSFLSPFLQRFHELPIGTAGIYSTWIYGLSGVPGLLLGGWIGDLLGRRQPAVRLVVSAVAVVAAVPLVFLALARPAGDIMGFAILMGIGWGLMYSYYSTVYPTIQELVEPSLRGTAMAMYFFAMYVLGASVGSTLVGFASDFYTKQAAALAGIEDLADKVALEPFRAAGLHAAMGILPWIAVALAVVLLAASYSAPRDLAKLRAWLEQHNAT